MAYNASQDASADPNNPATLVRSRVIQQLTPPADPTAPTGPTGPTAPTSTAPTLPSAPFAKAGPTGYTTQPTSSPQRSPGDPYNTTPTAPASPAVAAPTMEPATNALQDQLQQAINTAKANNVGPNAIQPMDAGYIGQQIAAYAAQHKNDPGFDQSLLNDPGYWVQKIQSTGGWQGDNASYWTGKFASANQQAPGGGGTATATDPGNAFTDQVRQLLMARMAADSAPVNDTDANIATPFNAAKLAADRATQQGQTKLAEQLYGQGDLGSNSLNQGVQQMAEQNATGLAQVKGSLIANEYANRRSDLNDAMQQALATGDAQSARQIQLAIANLDATVQREGIGAGLTESATNANLAAVLALLHP